MGALCLRLGGALPLIRIALSRLRTFSVAPWICLLAAPIILIGLRILIWVVYAEMHGMAQLEALTLRVVFITNVIDLVLILLTL